MTEALTPLKIKNIKPAASRVEIPDGKARGLYLVIQPSGARSWAVRYRFAGKPRKLTLGKAIVLAGESGPEQPRLDDGHTLAAARKLAADALLKVEQGRDPAAAKVLARADSKEAAKLALANSFRAVAEEYFRRGGDRRRGGGRDLRSRAWCVAVLDRLVYPSIGDRPIAEIKRLEVTRLLDQVEDASGVVMADRTLAIVRRIMNWHASRSNEFVPPIVRGMSRSSTKDRARKRILNDVELRALWTAAEAAEGPFPRLVQFILLTGARRTEAAKMQQSELVGADWVLPASRNKVATELVRPLTAEARSILDCVPKIASCRFIFSGDGEHPISGFSRMKARLDKTCGVTDWTLHDLRRTARSLMSRAGVPSDHAERCLGHVIAGVRGTYDRHEYYSEKKQAFEALAALIKSILHPPQDNVRPIRLANR